MGWGDVGPLNQSELEEISKVYRPLFEAPDDAVDVILKMSVTNIIGTSERHSDQIEAFIEHLPDDFTVHNNGSFHEYDWTLEHRFEAQRYNPKGYAEENRWANYGSSFYDDFNVYYVPDYVLNFLTDYGMWALPYEDRYGNEGSKIIKADEVWDFIESELPRAVKMWQLSRENYD